MEKVKKLKFAYFTEKIAFNKENIKNKYKTNWTRDSTFNKNRRIYKSRVESSFECFSSTIGTPSKVFEVQLLNRKCDSIYTLNS